MGAVRRNGLIALVACGIVFAWTMQGTGDNQNSHYALVRALANGTATIDATRGEVGDLNTHDVVYHRGHAYSNKAPGLAFVSLPVYLALRSAGVVGDGDPTRMLWALGLIGCVLPAVVLLVLVKRVCELFEAGFGTASAVVVGLGTPLLPFSALYFSHALSACLVFAAFALLLRERRERASSWVIAAAGLVAGFSVVTEYPNAIAAAVLLPYACARPQPLRRGAVYGAGLLAGILPLFAYQQWAFGSVTHVSYAGANASAGGTERGTLDLALLGRPSPVGVLETLFSTVGLLTLAPVVGCAAVAVPLLFRRGTRAEALVVAAICAGYVVYNSSFGSSFGGFSPGQRYLIPMLPFLALPLAVALRRFPATTTALALVSMIIAVTTTATYALAGYQLDWFDRVASRDFTSTVASLVGVTGWYTILPFFGGAIVEAAAAVLSTRWSQPRALELAFAGVAVLGWATLAATAPRPPALGGEADSYAAYDRIALALLAVTLAACAAWVVANRRAASRGLGRPTVELRS
jgi:hypothetical protein